MGIGHYGVIVGKAVQVGPVYLEKQADGSQELINALINGAKAQIDEFGGKAGNELLETSLEGKLRLALSEALLQVFVMLDVMELTVPEGTAIGLPLRLGAHLEPLVVAILQSEPRAIRPGFQGIRRDRDTLHDGLNVVGVDHRKNRIRVVIQIPRGYAKKCLNTFTDEGTTMGLSVCIQPIDEKDARHP